MCCNGVEEQFPKLKKGKNTNSRKEEQKGRCSMQLREGVGRQALPSDMEFCADRRETEVGVRSPKPVSNIFWDFLSLRLKTRASEESETLRTLTDRSVRTRDNLSSGVPDQRWPFETTVRRQPSAGPFTHRATGRRDNQGLSTPRPENRIPLLGGCLPGFSFGRQPLNTPPFRR